MKILDFFLFLWVIFALLDPDPDPQFECGSKPWLEVNARYNVSPALAFRHQGQSNSAGHKLVTALPSFVNFAMNS
jgi:hypothetical protein